MSKRKQVIVQHNIYRLAGNRPGLTIFLYGFNIYHCLQTQTQYPEDKHLEMFDVTFFNLCQADRRNGWLISITHTALFHVERCSSHDEV